MPSGSEQQHYVGEKDSSSHPALKEPTFYAEIRLTASCHKSGEIQVTPRLMVISDLDRRTSKTLDSYSLSSIRSGLHPQHNLSPKGANLLYPGRRVDAAVRHRARNIGMLRTTLATYALGWLDPQESVYAYHE